MSDETICPQCFKVGKKTYLFRLEFFYYCETCKDDVAKIKPDLTERFPVGSYVKFKPTRPPVSIADMALTPDKVYKVTAYFNHFRPHKITVETSPYLTHDITEFEKAEAPDGSTTMEQWGARWTMPFLIHESGMPC
jgi:hypothetical protein